MTFLQRSVYFKLKDHLDKPEISLILGPRQAGKTTLMKRLEQELQKSETSTVYFNLDRDEDRVFFTTQDRLVQEIRARTSYRQPVIFIDEAQQLPNAGRFLKGLYDMKTGCKVIVSGSGSLELKATLIESMTGRKRIFYCYPLTFTEFAAHKMSVQISQVYSALSTNPIRAFRLFEEYTMFGGYPQVVLAPTTAEKLEILRELYTSYVERDIQLLLGVEKETAFYNLVKVLAGSLGSIINRSELSNTLNLSVKTIEKYLMLLEKTFIIKLLHPFYRNPRTELTKSPKIYFYDLGLCNMITQNLVQFNVRPDKGSILENFTLNYLQEQLSTIDKINYWRTQMQTEVDFILQQGLEITPIEVKALSLKKPVYTRSFRSFCKKYQPKRGYVVNLTLQKQEKIEKTDVQTIPFYETPFKE